MLQTIINNYISKVISVHVEFFKDVLKWGKTATFKAEVDKRGITPELVFDLSYAAFVIWIIFFTENNTYFMFLFIMWEVILVVRVFSSTVMNWLTRLRLAFMTFISGALLDNLLRDCDETDFTTQFIDYYFFHASSTCAEDSVIFLMFAHTFTDVAVVGNVVVYYAIIYSQHFASYIILYAPLAAASGGLIFGWLIGYVYIGRVNSALMGLSLAAASYLLFIWPNARVHLHNVMRGLEEDDFFSEWFYGMIGDDAALLEPLYRKNMAVDLDFGRFINNSLLDANFHFAIDSISIICLFTILLISFIVHLYAVEYMKTDPHVVRFFGVLSLFTFFMLVLVMGGNAIILYIGWEGVGICSFALICHWYTRLAAVKAALKAILINKFGDMFFIYACSIALMYSGGHLTMSLLNLLLPLSGATAVQDELGLRHLDLICLGFLIAAMAKSAQLFFHVWLPDAMEGPTPVSALLHAATMVTAGVYLIVRVSFLMEYSVISRSIMVYSALATMILSSLIALCQYDIKKIIAYSTCSQLGLMFFACSLSAYNLALFHFFNHAFYKCLLFLISGVIIHQLKNEQDIRMMGGLKAQMPFTYFCFIIASLSLTGLPYFSGAVSKDLIINVADNYAFGENYTLVSGGLEMVRVASMLTFAYSFRLIYYVFLSRPRYRKNIFDEGYRDVSFKIPTYRWIFVFLCLMSIFSGSLFKNYFLCSPENYISVLAEVHIVDPRVSDSMFCKHFFYLSHISFYFCASLAWLFLRFMQADRASYLAITWQHDMRFVRVLTFFNRRAYIDDILNLFFIRPILHASFIFRQSVEAGVTRGFYLITKLLSGLAYSLNRGYVKFSLYFYVSSSVVFSAGFLAYFASLYF